MKPQVGLAGDSSASTSLSLEKGVEIKEKMLAAILDQAKAAQTHWLGLCRSVTDFLTPSLIALNSLIALERDKQEDLPSQESLEDYLDFWQFILQMAERGFINGFKAMNDYHMPQMEETIKACLNTTRGLEGEDIAAFMARQAQVTELLVHAYPQAIRDIAPEYGFHFDDGGYVKVAETDRFYLYQVLPRHKGVKVRKKGKPVIIIPPYVLGANVMAFLPGEDRSFVHCFANQGIPTYVRIVKDIETTPAVQVLTGEDDCLDTRRFCEQVKERHGRAVTLCGYCQGGFTAVVNLLSGELDGLMDVLITCVAPMDGTRSKGLAGFLKELPKKFKDLSFAIKILPNGNRVVRGELVSWIFKLKNIAHENPITAFYRDLQVLEKVRKIGKSAAAINYWLLYDVTELPLAIVNMSLESYTVPVAPDGTLPVKLFGRSLNFQRIKDKGIHWLICAAEKDDLVEKEASLAPLDWVEAEVTMFPRGHVAIATSWTLPTSECSLDKCFLSCRGPVRYQLDLDAALEAAARPTPAKKPVKPVAKPEKSAKPGMPTGKPAKKG
jgi:hypothetical protein